MVIGYTQEPTRNDSVAVGTTSTVICEPRNEQNERSVLLIRNISPNAADEITINVGFGEAVANKGIVLKQSESFSESKEAGYKVFQGSISAICATANGVLSIHER